ncbi:MAG: AAA family ATPase [Thermodesulfobacteria bacterium]|nr:AAA family ATPase [Thermodesulfobacteriota bacterium]
MKLAVCGKGGVGKSTVSALLCKAFLEDGAKVLAIDADPSPHLFRLLGVKEEVTPIAEMSDLLAERAQKEGPFYTLNPYVEDIPEKFSIDIGNLKLMVLGEIKKAGGGCACPEQTVLRRLLFHLLLGPNEVVIIDTEAGIEHFGRASIASVDVLLVVTQPYKGSIETTKKILEFAKELKISRSLIVGNCIEGETDKKYLLDEFGEKVVEFLPSDPKLRSFERQEKSLLEYDGEVYWGIISLKKKILGINSSIK